MGRGRKVGEEEGQAEEVVSGTRGRSVVFFFFPCCFLLSFAFSYSLFLFRFLFSSFSNRQELFCSGFLFYSPWRVGVRVEDFRGGRWL